MRRGLTKSTIFVADDCKASHVLKGVEKATVQVVDIVLEPWLCVDCPIEWCHNIRKSHLLE